MQATVPRPRLFTVDEYYAMGEAGIFGPEERVELLDGEILTMPPIGPHHAGAVNRLTHLLVTRFGDRAVVQVQNPVRLSNDSEPQPDFGLLRPRPDYYSARHAQPGDVFALIEVADTSLPYDGGRKLKAYARRGIAEYWVVNLRDDRVEIFRRPAETGYAERRVAERGEVVAFEAFAQDALTVDEILGAANAEAAT